MSLPLPAHMRIAAGRNLTLWWDGPPDALLARTVAAATSNIRPANYAGPDTCAKCHHDNHASWSAHPHRWMNMPAGPATVRGDFSAQTISYRGGTGTFETRGGKYFMRLVRDGTTRVYEITQTIGSRYYQYYVGKLIEGPEPRDHHFYQKDHVLPFGYWLAKKEWVPVVHIGPEKPDEERPDPFRPPTQGGHYAEYAVSCNYCHTTFALGDLMARRPQQLGAHAPVPLHWSVGEYLEQARPADFQLALSAMKETARGKVVPNPLTTWDSAHYAATFGVSCEACHLGCQEHVASGGKTLPRFFPEDPLLRVEGVGKTPETGRTHANLNWSCARCHTGDRPEFAAGMSTWNSVEFADAAKGSCYSKLRCIDCHSPHQALGQSWSKPPERDDAVCLKCHTQFEAPQPRREHTHHAPGSAGDHCLNCHMPRLNEGLNDVVRTHMITSPTRPDMIHANHPNACNLCHTDKPIDWTLGSLKKWYGKSYDDSAIARKYPKRGEPAALGWLASGEESVRLVAADALTRAKDRSALPQLFDALDDPFLLNRQFAAKGLAEMLGTNFHEAGYRFYMTREERRKPLADLRAKFLPPKGK